MKHPHRNDAVIILAGLCLVSLHSACSKANPAFVAGEPCVPGSPNSSCSAEAVADFRQACVAGVFFGPDVVFPPGERGAQRAGTRGGCSKSAAMLGIAGLGKSWHCGVMERAQIRGAAGRGRQGPARRAKMVASVPLERTVRVAAHWPVCDQGPYR